MIERLAPPICLFALAVALGFFRIGAKSIWYDEAVSIGYATSGLDQMLRTATDRDLNGLLYHVLLVGWVQLFGSGEGATRALSALLAAASVPLLYAVGQRVSGRKVAVGAALLMTVSQSFLAYAQEARMYAFALFASVLLTLLVLRAVERDRIRSWLAYGVAAGLGVYVHLFVGLVVVSHFLWLAVVWRLAPDRRVRTTGMIAAGVLFALGSVPLLAFAARQGAPSWIHSLSPETLYFVLHPIAGRSDVLLALAAVAAIVVAVRTFVAPHPPNRRFAVLVLAWALAPIALMIAISVVKPLLVARYLIVVVPPFALLGAMATLSIRRRSVSIAAFIVLFALTLGSGVQWYTGLPKDDWRGAVQAVSAEYQSGDYLTAYPARVIKPFDYYRRRLALTERLPPYANGVPIGPEVKRVWLVMRIEHGFGWPEAVVSMRDTLESAGFLPQGKIRDFDGVDVQLYAREPS